jgi:DNA-binding transcriptional LysR family regulator
MADLQDIYRLQAFVTSVDEGSFTAAVKKLHITQPALSARLKLLEEGLGCQLLERTGRGVRPTPLGELVYKNAKEILARMRHLNAVVNNHLELREGWLHLSGSAAAVMSVFPNAIVQFRSQHPDIQLTLHEQDSRAVLDGVRNGLVDIGVVTLDQEGSAEKDEELSAVTVHGIITDTLRIIASPQHPLVGVAEALERGGKKLLPMHLNKQNMILFAEDMPVRHMIDEEFRRLYIHPRIVMTLRSTESMMRMVEKNIGLSIVSELSMERVEGVCLLKVEGVSMTRRLVLISSSERTLPPAAESFLRVLKETCAVNSEP